MLDLESRRRLAGCQPGGPGSAKGPGYCGRARPAGLAQRPSLDLQALGPAARQRQCPGLSPTGCPLGAGQPVSGPQPLGPPGCGRLARRVRVGRPLAWYRGPGPRQAAAPGPAGPRHSESLSGTGKPEDGPPPRPGGRGRRQALTGRLKPRRRGLCRFHDRVTVTQLQFGTTAQTAGLY